MRDRSSRAQPESAWLLEIAATSAETTSPELEPGAELCAGRYLVQRELGRGGMGIVYAVRDGELQKDVALKTLTRRSPESIYRIKREFRGLSDIVHPNLARLHELFEDGGRWCFTLELVPGQTLLEALWGAPTATIRAALLQLAEGIGALHEAGKLHRDLKPSNVMLTPAGRVVILDFGLVEDIAAAHESRAGSGLSGTPAYMAPELRSQCARSPASDWYAFGVILWELFTGQLPVEAETQPARASSRTPPALGEGVPGDLAELSRALLGPDPAARPGTAEVLRCLSIEGTEGGAQMIRRSFAPPRARALVGRARELAELRAAYQRHQRGERPTVVLLSGESGIGKTALVQTFVNELEAAWVLGGRCYERELVPYKAFDAAIDELCRYLEQLPRSEQVALVPDDFAALCRLFPVLGSIDAPAPPVSAAGGGALGADPGDEEDAHELRRRGFEALGSLLGRIRSRRPVLLWLDDLQWTDADSTRLLLHLLRQPAAPAIFVVASHRTEAGARPPTLEPLYDMQLDMQLDVRSIELGPLARDDAEALLESISPGAPPALVDQARGHPFLLEELSRYADAEPAAALAWPSLAEAIAARVGALPDDERRVLELLSLAGRPMPEPLARSAAGPDWYAALQALYGARLARRSAVDGSVSCYHDAVREAVLGAVPLPRARSGHRALALAMLRSSEALPEHLSQHLVGSGHPALAAEQMAVAARRASASLAFERAAQHYQSALDLGRFDRERTRELQLARAHALSAAGRGNSAAELYLQVIQAGHGDDELELCTRAAEQYLLSGRLEPGLELLRRALQPLGVPIHTTALGSISSFLVQRARLRLRGYRFEPRPLPEAVNRRLVLMQRASFALARLDPLRASELGSRALVLALEAGSAETIASALVCDLVIGVFFRIPEAEFARRRERAERACALYGGAQERATLQTVLATAARLKPQPDLTAALAHLERFFEIHRDHVLPRASYERAWEEWARAFVRYWQGELGRVAREVPARLDEGWARGDHCIVPLWAGGHALLARLAVGDVASAERDLRRARQAWPSSAFTLQDLMLVVGEFHLVRHAGDRRATFQIAEAARQRLQKSPLRRMPNAVDTVEALRGHAALELAAQTQSASERRDLLQLVRRILRSSPRRANLMGTLRSHLLAAALHYQLGELEQADLALQRAEPDLASIPLYAHAVRYRRACLRGTPAEETQRFLAATGALDPAHLVDILLPGYGGAAS